MILLCRMMMEALMTVSCAELNDPRRGTGRHSGYKHFGLFAQSKLGIDCLLITTADACQETADMV